MVKVCLQWYGSPLLAIESLHSLQPCTFQPTIHLALADTLNCGDVVNQNECAGTQPRHLFLKAPALKCLLPIDCCLGLRTVHLPVIIQAMLSFRNIMRLFRAATRQYLLAISVARLGIGQLASVQCTAWLSKSCVSLHAHNTLSHLPRPLERDTRRPGSAVLQLLGPFGREPQLGIPVTFRLNEFKLQ